MDMLRLLLVLGGSVGMQASGDVMIIIGQHGRSLHELYPHFCGAKAMPTSLSSFVITYN